MLHFYFNMFPIDFPRFDFRRPLPLSISHQSCENDGGAEHSRKLLLWQFYKVNFQDLSILFMLVFLKGLIADFLSLKSNPSSDFSFARLLQNTQHNFFSFPSHQNLVKDDWILLHKLRGELEASRRVGWYGCNKWLKHGDLSCLG